MQEKQVQKENEISTHDKQIFLLLLGPLGIDEY